jgi:hypothetical protein
VTNLEARAILSRIELKDPPFPIRIELFPRESWERYDDHKSALDREMLGRGFLQMRISRRMRAGAETFDHVWTADALDHQPPAIIFHQAIDFIRQFWTRSFGQSLNVAGCFIFDPEASPQEQRARENAVVAALAPGRVPAGRW